MPLVDSWLVFVLARWRGWPLVRVGVIRAGVAWALAGSVAGLVARAEAVTPAPILAGYLPEWRAENYAAASATPLTDLILFSLEVAPEGGLDRARWVPAFPRVIAAVRAQAPHVRLHVALGGWERSAAFAAVAADAEKRARLVAAIAAFLAEHRLDGVDFDWEHPRDAAEVAGYGVLLRETVAALRPTGRRVSVTIAAWQELPADAVAAVDHVQIMAYDHAGPRHSTLDGAARDLATLQARGWPAAKLVLGVPFYGRRLDAWAQDAGYAELHHAHQPAPDADEAGGFYFNGVATLQAKVALARRAGLAGVMVWELGQDAPGAAALLPRLAAALQAPVPADEPVESIPLTGSGAAP